MLAQFAAATKAVQASGLLSSAYVPECLSA